MTQQAFSFMVQVSTLQEAVAASLSKKQMVERQAPAEDPEKQKLEDELENLRLRAL